MSIEALLVRSRTLAAGGTDADVQRALVQIVLANPCILATCSDMNKHIINGYIKAHAPKPTRKKKA